ncbi:uncharacterized protein Pyn_19307 [Prunus yedoensis var. nudiflora]|uniref:Uncharacterized protein n=1 Tax=Prunus yedoensis var. nudiflora TaxID=2094558 RepID=A0A314Y9K6_PRUYE|nr:uncharacterized protein Pyn_19307 [Prunus yedoensis var. nudiflora]
MASHSFAVALFFFFLLLNLASLQVFADVVLEDGYTVTTVIDGHKLGINPHLVLPRPGSSDLLVLDSSGSTVYTVPFPIPGSQESVIKRFPDNASRVIRTADRVWPGSRSPGASLWTRKEMSSLPIRATTLDGRTALLKTQRFRPIWSWLSVADKCALLVSDRGNQLVRLINLKPEDCARSSPSALGAASIWLLGLGLSCLFGLLLGIVIRPYIIRNEGRNRLGFSTTWRLCQINLGKQVQTLSFAIKSATASSTPAVLLLRRLFLLCISHLSLMFRTNHVGSRVSPKECLSLIDCDFHSDSSFKVTEITESSKYVDQLKDLVGFDGSMELCSRKQEDGNDGRSDVLSGSHGRIEGMIDSNIMGFVEGAKEITLPALGSNYGLVKRR